MNYFEHFLFFISAASGCVSISVFTLLTGVFVGIISSAAGLKMCTITVGIKKFESVIKNKRKNTR